VASAEHPSREDLVECVEQVQHVLETFNALLRIARVESGAHRSAFSALDLERIVRDVCELYQAAADERSIELVCEARAAVEVYGDRELLAQALTNLLDNAVKYTPEHGAISVRLHPVGGRAVLDVRDTGIGIPGALLPRLFDVFVQGDPGSRHSHGGLGIGLTVVRRMVELHGGDVTARSEGAGLGSTFTVRLPRIAAWPAGVP
jgi:two-component system, sensor histidine kinase